MMLKLYALQIPQSPTFAFQPIEYQLSGGATSISTITYRQDGGAVQNGLPQDLVPVLMHQIPNHFWNC